jgi:hypothetical protein
MLKPPNIPFKKLPRWFLPVKTAKRFSDEEADEYCPYCDIQYVLDAKTPQEVRIIHPRGEHMAIP